MGKCNQCGMCCRAVCLQYTKTEIATTDLDENRNLILYHWKRISRKKALEINPYLLGLMNEYWEGSVKLYWYSCTYIQEDNTCSIHDKRPPICKGYPWYGHDPKGLEFLYGENCGYRIDLLDKGVK